MSADIEYSLKNEQILGDKYVIKECLGAGGFGITYAGCDPSLNRRVAIKEYFPEGTAIRETAHTARVGCYSSEQFQERYNAGLRKCLNEARALAQLDDIPGIVRVLEYFQARAPISGGCRTGRPTGRRCACSPPLPRRWRRSTPAALSTGTSAPTTS